MNENKKERSELKKNIVLKKGKNFKNFFRKIFRKKSPKSDFSPQEKKTNLSKIVAWIIIALSLLILISFLVFAIGIYRFSWQGKAAAAAKKIFPYPAALVGLDMISLSELDDQTHYIQFFYEKTAPEQVPSLDSIQKQVLDRMIETRVIKKIGKTYGIVVSSKEIDEEFDKIVKENGGEDKVKQILSDLYGLDVSTFKKLISDQLYHEKLREKFENDLQMKVKVAHILIKIPKGKKTVKVSVKGKKKKKKVKISGKEWAKNKIESILERVKAGEDFAALAKKYSEDEVSAKDGGSLPEFAKDETVKEFEEAAFALSEPGDVTEIIETQFGFHIIKLEEKKGEIKMTFDEWLKEREKRFRIIKFIAR